MPSGEILYYLHVPYQFIARKCRHSRDLLYISDTCAMASILLLLFFLTGIVGNLAMSDDCHDLLNTVMSSLDILERKSENHDQLLKENEELKKIVKDNQAQISELMMTIRNLKLFVYETRKDANFQNEISRLYIIKDSKIYEGDKGETQLKSAAFMDLRPEKHAKEDLEKDIKKRIRK